MNEKYLGKYRIPSNRLHGWNYGNDGIYFITICTGNREHFFGKIVNGEMQLNEMGKIANTLWLEIPKKFPFIQLGPYVIMPNHIHVLLTIETQFIASGIGKNEITNSSEQTCLDKPDAIVDKQDAIVDKQDAINCVSTVGGFAGNKNPLLHQNISRVIRWYKGRCTFEIRKIHADFSWQTRFYDHIVRNQQALQNIENYIRTNPYNWNEDTFY